MVSIIIENGDMGRQLILINIKIAVPMHLCTNFFHIALEYTCQTCFIDCQYYSP